MLGGWGQIPFLTSFRGSNWQKTQNFCKIVKMFLAIFGKIFWSQSSENSHSVILISIRVRPPMVAYGTPPTPGQNPTPPTPARNPTPPYSKPDLRTPLHQEFFLTPHL